MPEGRKGPSRLASPVEEARKDSGLESCEMSDCSEDGGTVGIYTKIRLCRISIIFLDLCQRQVLYPDPLKNFYFPESRSVVARVSGTIHPKIYF